MQNNYDFSMFDKEPIAKPKKAPKYDLSMFGESADNVVEEMHPQVDSLHRMAVKNLSNSPENSLKYLKSKYPNLEIENDGDRFKIRDPQKDSNWYRLDPDTGFFSKDFLNDVGDLAYDAGSMVAEGVATGAGFVGGGGVGAIPAAIASGATMEAGRQTLGKALGVNDEVSMADVGTAGAVSGAIPMVGKSLRYGGKIAANKAAKHYPNLMSKLSGYKEDVIRNLAKDSDKFKDISEDGITQYSRDLKDSVKQTVRDERALRGADIDSQLDGIDNINLGESKGIVNNQIAEREEYLANMPQGQTDPIVEDELQQLYNVRSELFERSRESVDEAGNVVVEKLEAPDFVDGRRAKDYAQRTKDMGNVTRDRLHQSGVQQKTDNVGKFQLKVNREIGSNLEEQIKSQMDTPQAYDRYRKFIEDSKQLKRLSGDQDKSVLSYLKASRKEGKDIDMSEPKMLKEQLQTVSDWAKKQGKEGDITDLNSAARVLESREIFENPSLMDSFSFKQGKTPASVMGAGLGGALGFGATRSYYGGVIGAGLGSMGGNFIASPWAIKKTMQTAPKVMNATTNMLDNYGNKAYGGAKGVWELNREREAEKKKKIHTGF